MQKIIVFGPGWLGYKFKDYFNAHLSEADITEKNAIDEVLQRESPDVVINTAGKTGRPNIDWCEEHKAETVHSNITGPLILLNSCLSRNIRLVHLSSGCIFNGAPPRPEGFNEEDKPNPVSFYSWSKATVDEVLKRFPVLILRLRMPVDNKPHQRNLITKLSHYPKVMDVKNSITIIDDLLHVTKELIDKNKTGIFNIVNPGAIKHRDIMKWYKEIVDPKHDCQLVTEEEFIKEGLTKTGRSNCILDTGKLTRVGITLQNAEERILECLHEYKKHQ